QDPRVAHALALADRGVELGRDLVAKARRRGGGLTAPAVSVCDARRPSASSQQRGRRSLADWGVGALLNSAPSGGQSNTPSFELRGVFSPQQELSCRRAPAKTPGRRAPFIGSARSDRI